ncbi:MAG: capsular biosynthesis protein [Burkholderiales bacterium]|nr:capsular biosynthesis protein [Burkholderiales bacterium]
MLSDRQKAQHASNGILDAVFLPRRISPRVMIDLHCHYLSAVDDGAQNAAEALALARASVANGITHAVLTPHVHPGRYENTLSSLTPRFAAFRNLLQSAQVPLVTRLGGEVRLSAESLELLAENELPFIGDWEGNKVVLLEFPPGQIPAGAINAVGYLRARGILPMIAHPERNKDVMRDWRKIEPFVKEGCLLQITAASVCGMFGEAIQATAEQVLAAGWVCVVATDAHNLEHRPPVLAEARAMVQQRYGDALATLLTEVNPGRIWGCAGV